MKLINFLLLLCIIILLPGCDAIASIFEAGVWSGIFLVILVIALIIWLINKARR